MKTPRLNPRGLAAEPAGGNVGVEHSAPRRGGPPRPALASPHTTRDPSAEWYSCIMVSDDTCIIDSVQDVTQFGFALFYFIYIYFLVSCTLQWV